MKDTDNIENTAPPAETAGKDIKRKGKIFLAVTPIVGIVFPVIFLIFSVINKGNRSYVGNMFLILAAISLIAGGVMFIVYCIRFMETEKTDGENATLPRKIGFPITALAFELAAPFLFFVGLGSVGSGAFIGVTFTVLSVILPIAGVILAIISLCFGKNRIGKSGIILAVTAIALPICVIIGVTIFSSAGVALIHLM